MLDLNKSLIGYTSVDASVLNIWVDKVIWDQAMLVIAAT